MGGAVNLRWGEINKFMHDAAKWVKWTDVSVMEGPRSAGIISWDTHRPNSTSLAALSTCSITCTNKLKSTHIVWLEIHFLYCKKHFSRNNLFSYFVATIILLFLTFQEKYIAVSDSSTVPVCAGFCYLVGVVLVHFPCTQPSLWRQKPGLPWGMYSW